MSELTSPFGMIPIPAERSATKPRRTGLTMMMDWGIPIGALDDWLGLIARYTDLAKLVVGTARLYDDDYLRQKIDLYKSYEVSPFLGGQFLEYVYSTQGFDGVGPFCDEAVRVGVVAVEVSDNVVPLSEEERRRLISMVADAGLEVHGEVGSKKTGTDGAELISQAEQCLDAGASIVLVEGAELLADHGPNTGLIEQLNRGLDPETVMYELVGPWIRGTSWSDVYALKVFLVDTFGPDVNLANVMPDAIWETEALRCGLSTPGPPSARLT
jgi:phosphosulfolactate synthase